MSQNDDRSMGSSTNFVALDLLDLLASFKQALLKRGKSIKQIQYSKFGTRTPASVYYCCNHFILLCCLRDVPSFQFSICFHHSSLISACLLMLCVENKFTVSSCYHSCCTSLRGRVLMKWAGIVFEQNKLVHKWLVLNFIMIRRNGHLVASSMKTKCCSSHHLNW